MFCDFLFFDYPSFVCVLLCNYEVGLKTGQSECRADSRAQLHWRYPQSEEGKLLGSSIFMSLGKHTSSCLVGTMIRDRMCKVVEEVHHALRARGREDGIVCRQEDY